MAFPADEEGIRMLLQQNRDSSIGTLLPGELNLLINSFLPTQKTTVRAQSLLFLTKFSSDIRKKYPKADSDVPTSILVRTFSAPIEARLAATNESATLSALSFLTTLFQVDWASACEIFSRDGLVDAVMDTPDLYPSSHSISVAVSCLLSEASGHKRCRPLIAFPQVTSWLNRCTMQTKEARLRAAAAVALVKLSRGTEMDTQSSNVNRISISTSDESNQSRTDDDLMELMKNLIMTEDHASPPTLDAVEGLAYLSAEPKFKEAISSDPVFLKRLMALVSRHPSTSSFPASHADRITETPSAPDSELGLDYGLVVIMSNLCEYKNRLSEEEQQIEKLRRMTREPGAGGKLSANVSDSETLDDDEHVRIRGKKLVDSGAVGTLSGIIKRLGSQERKRQDTVVQRSVAKTLLCLVEEKTNRGRVLQEGGAKALLTIIRISITGLSLDPDNEHGVGRLDVADLLAIQALAKLSITSAPSAVFGPAQNSFIDAIRPFAILLLHPSASLLQQFEALMALTNIASVNHVAAERVSSFGLRSDGGADEQKAVGDIVKRAETLLLDNNSMLRRASTELICNLAGGAEGSFNYFGGSAGSGPKSRLHILVALSDVEDIATRLAASGVLAIITASPQACQHLAKFEMERHRVIPILVELICPQVAKEYREERTEDEETLDAANDGAGDPGLIHRGVVCVHNLFANLDTTEERKVMSLEAEKRGLVRALVQSIKSNRGGTNFLKPVAEVLKWIAESGVKLPI